MALCLQRKPYVISLSKVRADLIFCLVLIKQLFRYLISHNQVKEKIKKKWWNNQCIFNSFLQSSLGYFCHVWCCCSDLLSVSIHQLVQYYLIDFYICCVVVCSSYGIYSLIIKCNYKWFRRYFTISDNSQLLNLVSSADLLYELLDHESTSIGVLRTFDASQTCPGVTHVSPPHPPPHERAVKPRFFLLWLRSLRFVVSIRQVTEGLRFAEPKPSHNQSCAEF